MKTVRDYDIDAHRSQGRGYRNYEIASDIATKAAAIIDERWPSQLVCILGVDGSTSILGGLTVLKCEKVDAHFIHLNFKWNKGRKEGKGKLDLNPFCKVNRGFEEVRRRCRVPPPSTVAPLVMVDDYGCMGRSVRIASEQVGRKLDLVIFARATDYVLDDEVGVLKAHTVKTLT